MSFGLVVLFALHGTGCSQGSTEQPTKTPLLEQRAHRLVIEIAPQTLTFNPSRDDITVGKAVFHFYCTHPESVLINGVAPESQWTVIDLEKVAHNQFELPLQSINVPHESDGLQCMSIKVWFNEVTNQNDSLYYHNTDDRYALVSYCTNVDSSDWVHARPRFEPNRVATVRLFKGIIAKPFEIKLNARPLPERRGK